jgi:hypothetical protein
MSDLENEHGDAPVFNPADNPEVANAIAPKARGRAFQGFSNAPRVFRSGDAIAEKS